MASSTNHSYSFTTASILILLLLIIFPLAISQPISGEKGYPDLAEKKTRVGSRPPQCVRRCRDCKPCKPALVVTQRKMKTPQLTNKDDYYLLIWKCQCRDKYYQP